MKDWTAKDGRSNTSEEYERFVTVVEQIIRGSAADLINGGARTVAGLILSNLAHKHKFAPPNESIRVAARLFDRGPVDASAMTSFEGRGPAVEIFDADTGVVLAGLGNTKIVYPIDGVVVAECSLFLVGVEGRASK